MVCHTSLTQAKHGTSWLSQGPLPLLHGSFTSVRPLVKSHLVNKALTTVYHRAAPLPLCTLTVSLIATATITTVPALVSSSVVLPTGMQTMELPNN